MAEMTLEDQPQPVPFLQRTIDLTAVSWHTIGWVVAIIVAIAMRLPQLAEHALSVPESRRAHAAYRFMTGETVGPGNALPDTGPTALLLESLALFLFGASDMAARVMPALLGIGMVVLVLGLRPVVGHARALGAASLLALSPVMVYTSRIASQEIYVAAFALFTLVAATRIGLPGQSDDARRRWSLLTGAAVAATFGGGPSSLSVSLAIAVAVIATTLLDSNPDHAVRRSMTALATTRQAGALALIGFLVTLITLFSRVFTDFTALAGIGETISDWARLVTTASTGTPTQFFLLVVLLYEVLAVIFAIVAGFRTDRSPATALPWPLFAMWFGAALLIFSLSSGAEAQHSIHVVLPLVLFGGGALGEIVAELNPREMITGRLGLLLLCLVGLTVALVSELILLGRIGDAGAGGQPAFEAIATLILAVAPLAAGAYALARLERAEGRPGTLGATVLLAAAIFVGLLTIRSSIMLSFFNADGPLELVAQRTSTPAVDQVVKRVMNLSRDTTLTDGSARDPEGGHGLTIALDREVEWPYRWYFRDFPDTFVVTDGDSAVSGAQVVIAPDDAGMAEAAYSPELYPTINRIAAPYLAPDFGNILRTLLFPSRWEEGARYLLFRDLSSTAQPQSIAVGLIGELTNRIVPNTGPFGLYDRIGNGSGRGQFDQPRGIAVSADGERIYVVDMGNARVEQFDAVGAFIDEWGGASDPDVSFERTDIGLGPTGIATGPNGLVYVADTWNHRVVVLDNTGRMVHEFGAFADTADAPDASIESGSFFGPRAIAIHNDEIFVVDTGNERVQVFGMDGSFIRAFGGNGATPSQFVEPVGIAISADGRVFVADSGNGRISVWSTIGEPLEQWTVEAWAGSTYFEPYLAFDDAGLLYASSSATGSIEVFNPVGELMLSIRQVESEALEQPVGLAWSPEGSLLITDKGRNGVFRYTPVVESELPVDGDGFIELNPGASPAASPVGNG